jgi:hypothetical protein
MTTPMSTTEDAGCDRASVYDLRIYDVTTGELETLERILRDLALPMMPEYGMNAIGFWVDRESNTLYQLTRHDSFDSIQSNWDKFHADPRWQIGLKERRQDRIVVKDVKTVFLKGAAGLPPFITEG